ncbi:uncharacterized protein LOC135223710 [Macrobrachium nipponense]|uniref:uncharacterized protein LOC135223710 n=1 Tax=Macrobrachium nipponense TaxID=159736 RepID=UPI0030C85568
MDSRGGRYDSDCKRDSSRKSSSSNSNSGSRRNSGDQGLSGQGGRGSPSYYYYGVGPAGEVTEPHREEEDLYARNNNDYSKYTGDHLPSTSDYGYYGSESSAAGDYSSSSSSSCDVNCNEEYGTDYRYSHQQHHHSGSGSYPQCQRGYGGYGDSQCYGDAQRGGCGSCSPSQCGGDRCDLYGSCGQREYPPPSRVQVTAKVLFGSVSAISNLKQKKSSKK